MLKLMDGDEAVIASRLAELGKRLQEELNSDFKEATLRLIITGTSLVALGLFYWFYVAPLQAAEDGHGGEL